MRAKADVCI